MFTVRSEKQRVVTRFVGSGAREREEIGQTAKQTTTTVVYDRTGNRMEQDVSSTGRSEAATSDGNLYEWCVCGALGVCLGL